MLHFSRLRRDEYSTGSALIIRFHTGGRCTSGRLFGQPRTCWIKCSHAGSRQSQHTIYWSMLHTLSENKAIF